MLHTINPEILFLKQEDVIKAGLLDMKQILAVTEKTYAMLGQGLIKNPPKTNTSIPDKENWQSFFNAMPCYIGGNINIGGIKWAAESKKNATIPVIPYGIDISILSDPETVLPFCILDGTLITAMRTSAVGGLMAKYAAPSNADTACLVGAGVIGRTMISAVHEALPQIKTMYLCDIDVAKAEGIAKEYGDSLGVEIIPTSDSKAAALKSQLIVGETTAPKPFMDASWLTPGCGLVSMHSNEVIEDVFLKADGLVADYPPNEFHTEVDGKDTIVGFDVSIAQYIADDLGVELKVVDMSFDNLCINLAKGDFDIVIAGMASTEERQKSVDFSDPYFKQQQAILIRKDDDSLYNKPEDLAGHKVGVQNGAIQVPIANELAGEENVIGLVKAQDLIMELKSGKLDVVYIDYTAALAFAAANDDILVKDIGIESDSEGQCIGVQKGNEDFVAYLNEKIAEMQEQGLIDQYVAEAQTLAGIE